MKKIILAALFLFLGITMKAQQLIPLQDIKSHPNDIINYAETEVAALNQKLTLEKNQATEIKDLLYSKYKNLTGDLNSDQMNDLSQSVRDRIKIILGSDKYLKLSQDEQLLDIITGAVYLQ